MYIPPAAMIQAMMAPNGPVAAAKVRGSEKMPAPTMDPTTMPASTGNENFCVDGDTDDVAVAVDAVGDAMATSTSKESSGYATRRRCKAGSRISDRVRSSFVLFSDLYANS